MSTFLTDYDECRYDAGNVNCAGASICVNTKGSYSCECPHGYETTKDASLCKGKQTVVYIFCLHEWERNNVILRTTHKPQRTTGNQRGLGLKTVIGIVNKST